jgi:hypothetical protein
MLTEHLDSIKADRKSFVLFALRCAKEIASAHELEYTKDAVKDINEYLTKGTPVNRAVINKLNRRRKRNPAALHGDDAYYAYSVESLYFCICAAVGEPRKNAMLAYRAALGAARVCGGCVDQIAIFEQVFKRRF